MPLAALFIISVFSFGRIEGAIEKRRDILPLKEGIFLVAGPRLTDPNFAQSVVLLIEYGENGAVGLIVNRPTDLLAEEALPEVEELKGLKHRLYFGGPVHPQRLFALVETDRALEGGRRVLAGVTFTGNRDALLAVLKDGKLKRSLRLYAGYAGWAPGQLESELRRGAWVVKDADRESVFSRHPLTLWEKLMGRGIGIQVRHPADVPLNLDFPRCLRWGYFIHPSPWMGEGKGGGDDESSFPPSPPSPPIKGGEIVVDAPPFAAGSFIGSTDDLDQAVAPHAGRSLGPLRRIPDGDQGHGEQVIRDL